MSRRSYYIFGGLTALLSLLASLYMLLGIMVLVGDFTGSAGEAPPRLFGWIFIAIGAGAMTLGLTLAILMILTGRWIAARRRRVFCLVVAGLCCLSFPLGTALGVFTIVVLVRDSVVTAFEGPADATTTVQGPSG